MFRSSDGGVSLEVVADGSSVWASQAQIEQLFGVDRSQVSRHLSAVFREGEVDPDSSLRKTQTTAVGRPAVLYGLDAILAVGYRARSARAIEFRRWATDVLHRYLLDGVALNEQRLAQIGQIVTILGRSTDELVAGVADVLAGYLPGLTLLRDFDAGSIDVAPTATPDWMLTVGDARDVIQPGDARDVIQRVAVEFPEDELFGRERGGSLAGIVGTVYQGFAGVELYPTVEEKAANLLYLVVKDHPLSDGNKRSAAALFVTFLAKNGQSADAAGHPRISNNALAAITLMVAMSDPKEKDLMIALLVRMLTEGGA